MELAAELSLPFPFDYGFLFFYIARCYVRGILRTIAVYSIDPAHRISIEFLISCAGLSRKSRYGPVLIELQSALAAIIWGAWMAFRSPAELFRDHPLVGDIFKLLSFEHWGVVVLMLGALQLGVLIRGRQKCREITCFAMTLLWLFLSGCFIPKATIGLMFPLFALGQAFRYLQLHIGSGVNGD